MNERLWQKLVKLALTETGKTVSRLPKPLRDKAAAVPVICEPLPDEDDIADGIAPDTLGLFMGEAFPDTGAYAPLPAQIILYLENLWLDADGDERWYREEVRKTFLHELGHYLGLDESALEDRGLE